MMNIKLTPIFLLFLLSCTESRKQKQEISSEFGDQTIETDKIDSISYRNVFTDTITVLPYDIPAQRFDETAQTLCHATGCFIETDLEKTGSIHVNSIKGRMSILEAVQTAIKGTDLIITKQTPNELTIKLISR